MRVRLEHECDWAGFRRVARSLLAREVPPDEVTWLAGAQHDDLFGGEPEPICGETPADMAFTLPRALVDQCRSAILHREPQRLALLYRVLWRLLHEPDLRHDPLDADLQRLHALDHAVRRDLHKMQAFVRFRPVPSDEEGGEPLHVAWYEPDHRIVDAIAPWFSRRFANLRWAILTPERCVEWDRRELHFRAGTTASEAPGPDAGEALWLTYYRSIFNPARLNVRAMQQHMPRKFWRNLPEARLIAPLTAQANERSAAMIAQEPTTTLRRLSRLPAKPQPAQALPGLAQLHAQVQACRACPLGALATQSVPGEGPPRAQVMVVGEQPGEQEDLRGRPFVGPAGQLLDRALAAADIAREAVFVTNAVRHFKFELRGQRRIHKTPAQQEAAACSHWLEQEIALVDPGVLLALGGTAARSLLGHPVSVLSQRGQWARRPDGREVLVTVHPSYLLRLPPAEFDAALAHFVRDLALLKTRAPRVAAPALPG